MKPIAFTLTVMVIVMFRPAQAAEPASDEAQVHECLNHLSAYRDSGRTYADFDLEFRHDKQYFNSGQHTTRCRVRYGACATSPFETLEWMLTHLELLRNVKVENSRNGVEDSRNGVENPAEQIYSMMLPGAMRLSQGDETALLDTQITVQLYQGLPRYVSFEAAAPHKRWAIQRVRVLYLWNYYTYVEDGEAEEFWVPVQILILTREKKAAVRATLSEQWTLQKILNVKEAAIQITGATSQH